MVSEDMIGEGDAGGVEERETMRAFMWVAGGVVVSRHVAADCHPTAACRLDRSPFQSPSPPRTARPHMHGKAQRVHSRGTLRPASSRLVTVVRARLQVNVSCR